MAKKTATATLAKLAEETRLAARIAALPGRIVDAALLLSIGPLFAMTLAESGKLPGVTYENGEWKINMLRINLAINDLVVDITNVPKWRGVIDPKFGLDRPELDPVPFGPDLGEPYAWPEWMASVHYCGACNHDGRHNQLAYKQPCYGREASRYMRSA